MTVNLGIIGMGYCGRQQLQAAASVKGLNVVAVADSRVSNVMRSSEAKAG